jgi:hypothetical protein
MYYTLTRTKHLTYADITITTETQTITTEELKRIIKKHNPTKTSEGWSYYCGTGDHITIKPAPNPNRVCTWNPPGTSRTHYTNTKWWMNDFNN